MAKRKTRKTKNKAPSQRRQKQLLRTKQGSQGQKLYKVTPSNVKQSEIKWMAQTINRRLRALEKAGLTEASSEYRMIQNYATGDPTGKGSVYNVNYDTGNIRISYDTRKMTSEERAYLITVMRNILTSKTGTVRGTKAAMMKGYRTSLAMAGKTEEEISQDQWGKIWKTFRENVSQDMKDKGGSQMVMKLLRETNFYEMSLSDMETAFSYMNNYETPADWADELVSESPFDGELLPIEFT